MKNVRYELLQVKSLFLDPKYQREVSKPHVKALTTSFDERLLGTIVVSFRDDKYYILDGQHRVMACKSSGVTSVMAVVLDHLTMEEEAELFDEYMTERTMVIDALIRVTVLFLTAIIIPSLKGWIDRNRDNRELQLVLQMADIAVKSVENDLKTEPGLKKNTEAIARLANQINAWGLKGFTADELNHYIETAVKEMWDNELPEPLPLYEEYPEDEL